MELKRSDPEVSKRGDCPHSDEKNRWKAANDIPPGEVATEVQVLPGATEDVLLSPPSIKVSTVMAEEAGKSKLLEDPSREHGEEENGKELKLEASDLSMAERLADDDDDDHDEGWQSGSSGLSNGNTRQGLDSDQKGKQIDTTSIHSWDSNEKDSESIDETAKWGSSDQLPYDHTPYLHNKLSRLVLEENEKANLQGWKLYVPLEERIDHIFNIFVRLRIVVPEVMNLEKLSTLASRIEMQKFLEASDLVAYLKLIEDATQNVRPRDFVRIDENDESEHFASVDDKRSLKEQSREAEKLDKTQGEGAAGGPVGEVPKSLSLTQGLIPSDKQYRARSRPDGWQNHKNREQMTCSFAWMMRGLNDQKTLAFWTESVGCYGGGDLFANFNEKSRNFSGLLMLIVENWQPWFLSDLQYALPDFPIETLVYFNSQRSSSMLPLVDEDEELTCMMEHINMLDALSRHRQNGETIDIGQTHAYCRPMAIWTKRHAELIIRDSNDYPHTYLRPIIIIVNGSKGEVISEVQRHFIELDYQRWIRLEKDLSWIYLDMYFLFTKWDRVWAAVKNNLSMRIEEVQGRATPLPILEQTRQLHHDNNVMISLREHVRIHKASTSRLRPKNIQDITITSETHKLRERLNHAIQLLDYFEMTATSLLEQQQNLLSLAFNIETVSQGQAVARLNALAFVFLPLSFAASIFGITTFTIEAVWFPALALPLLFTTIIIAVSVDRYLSPRRGRMAPKRLFRASNLDQGDEVNDNDITDKTKFSRTLPLTPDLNGEIRQRSDVRWIPAVNIVTATGALKKFRNGMGNGMATVKEADEILHDQSRITQADLRQTNESINSHTPVRDLPALSDTISALGPHPPSGLISHMAPLLYQTSAGISSSNESSHNHLYGAGTATTKRISMSSAISPVPKAMAGSSTIFLPKRMKPNSPFDSSQLPRPDPPMNTWYSKRVETVKTVAEGSTNGPDMMETIRE